MSSVNDDNDDFVSGDCGSTANITELKEIYNTWQEACSLNPESIYLVSSMRESMLSTRTVCP